MTVEKETTCINNVDQYEMLQGASFHQSAGCSNFAIALKTNQSKLELSENLTKAPLQ